MTSPCLFIKTGQNVKGKCGARLKRSGYSAHRVSMISETIGEERGRVGAFSLDMKEPRSLLYLCSKREFDYALSSSLPNPTLLVKIVVA
jgi:hypothetical protein